MPESNQGGSSEVLVLDLPIMLARKQAEGAVVRVEGIINVLPGVFSSQYFYIQDSEAGIQIYYYKKDFPDLKLFNHVKIKGEISIVSSGIRIKIRDRSDIEIISSETISPSNVKTGDVGENYEGMLVKIKGKITGTKGSIFYLDDGSGQVKCYIKSSTNIKKPRLTKNMEGEIIGIVSKSNDIWQIMPRMQSDLLFISPIVKKIKKQALKIVSVAKAQESKFISPKTEGIVLAYKNKAAKAGPIHYKSIIFIYLM